MNSARAVADRDELDLAIDIDRGTTAAGAYPLLQISYAVACTDYTSASHAANVKGYLSYVVSADGQQAAADATGSTPLSGVVAGEARAAVDSIS